MTPREVIDRVFAILDGVEFDFGAHRRLHALKQEIVAERSAEPSPYPVSPGRPWELDEDDGA